MNDIVLQHISHRYGDACIIHDLNLTIKNGEFFTLLGPSGCGKTTLLRILAGLIYPTEGDVLIGDKNITYIATEKRNMGIVFQNYALFPNMTVRDNILYGLKIRNISRERQLERYNHYINLVGLKEYENRRIQELSGGQQQRVAIARALIIEPHMLLLDEPMSNLDISIRSKMREEIRNIHKAVGITTLFITHDQQEALSISDKIAVMNDGHILQVGTPDQIYNHPENKFVANFVGKSNEIEDHFIRPERMMLTRNGDGIEAVITDIHFNGIYYEYEASTSKDTYCIIELNKGCNMDRWAIGDNCIVTYRQEENDVNEEK